MCACLKCTWCSDEIVACTGTFLQVFRPREIVVTIYHFMSIYFKLPVIIIENQKKIQIVIINDSFLKRTTTKVINFN